MITGVEHMMLTKHRHDTLRDIIPLTTSRLYMYSCLTIMSLYVVSVLYSPGKSQGAAAPASEGQLSGAKGADGPASPHVSRVT